MKKIILILSFFALTANAQTVALQSFATGFTTPVEIAHPVGDSRLFVVQKGGLIRILNSNGTINATPFLTITGLGNASEQGLLGLAFHPNYTTNGYFYVNYTRASDGATVIARYTVSADPNIANAASANTLLTIAQPASNHNGGTIKFGPDGFLYIGMGDGGFGGDPDNRSQNINDNLGKMLRLDVDSASPYGIPPTNPYVGVAGNDEIWAIGVRNPWKFSFNRLNGDLWIADVGQNLAEEINKIASPLPNSGLNFGWRCFEGSLVYDNSGGNCPNYLSTVAPITQYGHGSSRCSITGGYFYTGSMYPNFANKYFFADYCTAEIGYISGTSSTITWAINPTGSITTFGEDVNGELYAAVSGTIYKIIDSSLSNSDFEKNGFSIYPNPAKDKVYIKNTSDIVLTKVELFDITGKLLLSETAAANPEASLQVADLAKGMYVVIIETQSGNRYNTKLVIQ
ncbi:PQQ-dependent sugar dehydrogenase [Flavobacterium sp. 25HG05S-40]|uniref:PQQ-dependent sugar dehydrogenase n=1 Tax=Flavobacterium sp. 25HG05S-40 TaxID=3458682 RepID=UPI004044DD02